MALQNPFKLEKLKIKAFSDRARGRGDLIDTFECMFNPESFKQKYEILYGRERGMNSVGEQVNYARSKPTDLHLNLILDDSGATDFGLSVFRKKETVAERVKKFLQLTFRVNGDIHEPNYLLVEWGDLIYSCRLGSVEINYTSFNRDGTALRAELTVVLFSDRDVARQMAEQNLTSPDLTHTRIVQAGDTLPLLTRQIYGTSRYYLRVAQVNNLENFRNLTPGQEIVFPPLDSKSKVKTEA